MRICDAAVLVLRETNNPAVMWGDSVLLHQIAARAGRPPEGWLTERRVLAALSRQPGSLQPGRTRLMRGRWVRIFRMPNASWEQRLALGDRLSAAGHGPGNDPR